MGWLHGQWLGGLAFACLRSGWGWRVDIFKLVLYFNLLFSAGCCWEAAEVVAVVRVIGPEVFAGPSAMPPVVPAGLLCLRLGLRAADPGLVWAMYIL